MRENFLSMWAKIFYQCDWNFSINVLGKFQSMLEKFQSMLENFLSMLENFLSMLENFLSMSENFQSMRGNFLSMSENFQSMLENFPSMWVKNFNQWVIFFGRQRKNAIKRYLVLNKTTLLPTIPIWFLERLFTQKTKKRNWKKERFFYSFDNKMIVAFSFFVKRKKAGKGEKRKKSKVCIFLL